MIQFEEKKWNGGVSPLLLLFEFMKNHRRQSKQSFTQLRMVFAFEREMNGQRQHFGHEISHLIDDTVELRFVVFATTIIVSKLFVLALRKKRTKRKTRKLSVGRAAVNYRLLRGRQTQAQLERE